jgi:hypothetical protein
MSTPKTDLDKARHEGRIDGLKAAEEIARREFEAAKKEYSYKNLSPSVRERTRVRRDTANKIAVNIRKELRS